MNFAQSPWLYALPVLLLLAVTLFWLGEKRRQARLKRLLGRAAASGLSGESRGRQLSRYALLTCALALIILALARPRFGFETREYTQRGLDIMLLIDVSRSMLAEDIQPNRMTRARWEVIDLLRVARGDRIGLIPFAGMAFVQCPLTVDYQAIELFLDHLNTDLIPVQGTAIGDAIRLATDNLQGKDSARSGGKVIILITDGEDQYSEPLAAAREAAGAGITIHAIGIGAREGAPIPNGHGGYVVDERGEMVMTRLDDALLQQIADLTGGSYLRSETGHLGLERLYHSKIKGQHIEGELFRREEQVWFERFFWLSALAVSFLVAESIWRR